MTKQNKLVAKFKNPDFRYRYFHVLIIYIFMILLTVVVGVINADFLKVNNLRNILISAFPLMLAAFGQTLVILTGGIDLSIGGIIAFCNVTCAVIMTNIPGTGGVVIAIAVTIIAGLLSGALNGFFITKGRLPSIIVTLASATIFGGISLFILPIPGGKVDPGFAKFLSGNLAGIPVALILLIVIVYVLRLITNKTAYGISIRAIGGSEGAAYSTGIIVWKVKFITYVLCGLFCSFAGLFLAAQMYSGDPNIGANYAMNSITATVAGGTLMSGAIGDVLGTVAGVFIIYIINNMLNLIGVSSFYQSVFQGLILIVALIISNIKSK